MTTITVCATAGSAPACPVPPEGVPAEPFCPADVAPGPDGELAGEEPAEVAGPADPHAVSASTVSASTVSASTGSASTPAAGRGPGLPAGHGFTRRTVSCPARLHTLHASMPRHGFMRCAVHALHPTRAGRGTGSETPRPCREARSRVHLAPSCHTVRLRTPGRSGARCGPPPVGSCDAPGNNWNT